MTVFNQPYIVDRIDIQVHLVFFTMVPPGPYALFTWCCHSIVFFLYKEFMY